MSMMGGDGALRKSRRVSFADMDEVRSVDVNCWFAIIAAVLILCTGYTQDHPAQSTSFGYSLDNANQWKLVAYILLEAKC